MSLILCTGALCSPIMAAWAEALNDTTFPGQRWEAWSHQLNSRLSSGDKVCACSSVVMSIVSQCLDLGRAWQHGQALKMRCTEQEMDNTSQCA